LIITLTKKGATTMQQKISTLQDNEYGQSYHYVVLTKFRGNKNSLVAVNLATSYKPKRAHSQWLLDNPNKPHGHVIQIEDQRFYFSRYL
jgi:hypothetical protein